MATLLAEGSLFCHEYSREEGPLKYANCMLRTVNTAFGGEKNETFLKIVIFDCRGCVCVAERFLAFQTDD